MEAALQHLPELGPAGCRGLLPLDCRAGCRFLCLSGFPVTVIANGVDVSLFSPQPDAAARLRRRLSVGSEERVVLFAAPRFSRAKGFDLFVQLARLCRDAPVRFLAAGGEGRSPLRNLTILGHISNREQLAELYAAADVLAVCSRQETFPPCVWRRRPAERR